MCNPVILTEKENICIAHCQGCNRISLRFNNLLVGFQLGDLYLLQLSFENISFSDCCIRFSDHKQRIVIDTSQPEVQLCLEESEYEFFKERLSEAILMLEINNLLSS